MSVRIVGEIKQDKLDSEKKATVIVEENFAKHKPSQYFASIKVFEAKATGIKGGERRYGEIVSLRAQTMDGSLHNPSMSSLVALQAKVATEDPFFTRILYAIKDASQKQPYVIALRAIQTHDFLTAKVSEIPWSTLNETADEILKACPNVSTVYYDVTPKPPATIEME
ncbi:MAG: hypothetical protein ACFFBZ_14450 [Promethearchaeota archaeon]